MATTPSIALASTVIPESQTTTTTQITTTATPQFSSAIVPTDSLGKEQQTTLIAPFNHQTKNQNEELQRVLSNLFNKSEEVLLERITNNENTTFGYPTFSIKDDPNFKDFKLVLDKGKLYIIPAKEDNTKLWLVEISGVQLPENPQGDSLILRKPLEAKLTVDFHDNSTNPLPPCLLKAVADQSKETKPTTVSKTDHGIEIKDPKVFDIDLGIKLVEYASKNRPIVSLQEELRPSNLLTFFIPAFGLARIAYRQIVGKNDGMVTKPELEDFLNRVKDGKIPIQEISTKHTSEEIMKALEHLINNFDSLAKPVDDRHFWDPIRSFNIIKSWSLNPLLSVGDLREIAKMMNYESTPV